MNTKDYIKLTTVLKLWWIQSSDMNSNGVQCTLYIHIFIAYNLNTLLFCFDELTPKTIYHGKLGHCMARVDLFCFVK